MYLFSAARTTPCARLPTVCVALSLLLSACSPTYNWREVRMDDSDLVAMLPCKPDTGSRRTPIQGQEVLLHMIGCDAGEASFAIARADLKDSNATAAVLTQWRSASLTNMGATSVAETMYATASTSRMPALLMVTAHGKRQDGSPVRLQGVWFTRGSQVFQAVIYANPPKVANAQTLRSDEVDAFFSGLKFQ